MPDATPKFAEPPVVETVLGVQFDPLPVLTAGHFGWYWKSFLGAQWVKPSDAPELPDQFEQFGDLTRELAQMALRWRVQEQVPMRFQVWTAKEDRLIQVQRSRFLYNWRKRDAEYPTYEVLRPEFDRELERFQDFVRSAGLGESKLNQWEVTYVNHIPKGELWQSPSDWPKLIPGILAPSAVFTRAKFQDLNGEWHFELEPQLGRLHVSVQSGRTAGIAGQDVLVLQLTARGPAKEELDAGLNLGHEAIVFSFTEMTSPIAHKVWKRSR